MMLWEDTKKEGIPVQTAERLTTWEEAKTGLTEADWKKQEADRVTYYISQNITDPEEAEATLGLTDYFSKIYNLPKSEVIKDIPGFIERNAGQKMPSKTFWRQVWDATKDGWYTDQLGTVGSALMYTDDPDMRKYLEQEAADIKSKMSNPEGNKPREGFVGYATNAVASAGNLMGTMIRPFLTNVAVTSLIPAAKLPAFAAKFGTYIPNILAKGAEHAISMGATWTETWRVEAGNIYLDLMDAGVDPIIAKKDAEVHGAIAGFLEAAPFEYAFSKFPFLKTSAQKAFMKLSAKTRTKAGVIKTFGNLLKDTAIPVLTSTALETATEVLQEVSAVKTEEKARTTPASAIKDEKMRQLFEQDYAEWEAEYDKLVQENKDYFASKEYSDYVKDRLWETGINTLMGAGLLAGAGGAINLATDLRQNQREVEQERKKRREELKKEKEALKEKPDTEYNKKRGEAIEGEQTALDEQEQEDTADTYRTATEQARETYYENPTDENKKILDERTQQQDEYEKQANVSPKEAEYNEIVNSDLGRNLTEEEIDTMLDRDLDVQAERTRAEQETFAEPAEEAQEEAEYGESERTRFASIIKEKTAEDITDEQAEILVDMIQPLAKSAKLSTDAAINAYFQQDIARTVTPGETVDINGQKIKIKKNARGAVWFDPKDGKAIILLTQNAKFDTWVHEFMHIYRRHLTGDMLSTLENHYKVKDGKWTVAAEEQFAKDGLNYLMTRKAPAPELESIFKVIADALLNIYRTLSGRNMVSDDIARVFDQLFADPESAFGTTAEFDPDSLLYQDMGELGASQLDAVNKSNYYMSNLEMAKSLWNRSLEKQKRGEQGESAKSILMATGWRYDEIENEWKYETVDPVYEWTVDKNGISTRISANIPKYFYDEIVANPKKGKHTTLRKLWGDNNIIVKAYPQLADNDIFFTPTGGGTDFGVTKGNKIKIRTHWKDYGREGLRSAEAISDTLLHEVQHWVQNVEGFAQGGDETAFIPKGEAYKEYIELLTEWTQFSKDNNLADGERITPATHGRYIYNKIGEFNNQLDFLKRKMQRVGLSGYWKIYGEIMARAVARRRLMTKGERQNISFEDTLKQDTHLRNVSPKEFIIIKDAILTGMSMRKSLADMEQRIAELTGEETSPEAQYAEIEAQYKGTDQWLKAPNGQPTNLTERQWVQVRTPLFKAWFGDWENDPQNASKVVDENGEPLVVWHGSPEIFDTFDFEKLGKHSADNAKKGFCFVSNRELAESYGWYTKYDNALLNTRSFKNMQEEIFALLPDDKQFIKDVEFGRNAQGVLEETNRTYQTGKEIKDRIAGLISDGNAKQAIWELTHWHPDEGYKNFLKRVRTLEKKYTFLQNNTMGTFLNIRNPQTDLNKSITDGQDGYIARDITFNNSRAINDRGRDFKTDFFIASKEPTQIKSATDNVGTFDETNPSILYQSDEEEYREATENGNYIEDEIIEQYKGQAWADDELLAREDYRREAGEYDDYEQFLADMVRLDPSKTDDYYEQIWNTTDTRPDYTKIIPSLTRRMVEKILYTLKRISDDGKKLGWPWGDLVKAYSKEHMISEDSYKALIDQMKAAPEEYMASIAECFSNQDEFTEMMKALSRHPDLELERIKELERAIRGDQQTAATTMAELEEKNKTLKEEYREARKQGKKLEKHAAWLEKRIRNQKISAMYRYFAGKIFHKPPKMCAIDYVEKIREIQAKYTLSNMLDKTRARLEHELLTTTDPKLRAKIQDRLDRTSLRTLPLAKVAEIAAEITALRREGVDKRMAQLLEIREQRLDQIEKLKKPLGEVEPLDKTGSVESTTDMGHWYEKYIGFWCDINRITEYLGKEWVEWLGSIKKAFESEERNVDRRRTACLDKMAELKITPSTLSKTEEINGKTYTHDILMSWYIYLQNEDSANALIFGNFKGDPDSDAVMDEIYDRIDKGLSLLTQEEKDFADWMIESFGGDDWKRVEATVRNVDNASPEQVPRYFMMIRQLDGTQDAQTEPVIDLKERTSRAGRVSVKKGFTKERIHNISPQHQTPIQLGALSIYMKAIRQQEHYIAFAQLSKDMKYVFAGVSEALTSAHGKSLTTNIGKWIDRVIDPRAYNNFYSDMGAMGKIINNSVVAALSYNILSYLKQFPSVVYFLPYCDGGTLVNSFARFIRNWKEITDESKEKSVYLKNRRIDDPITIGQEQLMNPNARFRSVTKFTQFGMKPFGWVDGWACTIGWNAVYTYAMEHGATEEEAVNRANDALLKTQPQAYSMFSPTVYTKPIWRTMLLFSRQINQINQMLTADIWRADKDLTPVEKTQYVMRMMFCIAFGALIMGWAGRKFGGYGDDDKPWYLDMLQDVGANTVTNLQPFVGPALANTIQRKMYTSGGYVDPVSQYTTAMTRFLQQPVKQDEFNLDGTMRMFTEAMGAAGLPKVFTWRTYKALKESDAWYLFIGSPLGGKNGRK